MKDLITSIASIILLMIFIMQFAGNQVTHNRIFQADMAVESFRDTVKEQGYISEENRQRLVNHLAEICSCSSDSVLVEGVGSSDTLPAERGELIFYRVRFPLQNLVALGAALGIAQNENMAWFDQEGWVVSRYEESDYNDGDHDADGDGNSL